MSATEGDEPSLGIQPLKFNTSSPIHATRIGNIIYLAPSPLKPADFPPDLISEEHELHLLEKGLTKLKSDAQQRSDNLKSRQEAGETLSREDEEWLDHNGNLITEQVVVDSFLALEERNPCLMHSYQFEALQSIIMSYQSILSEATKKKMNNKKNVQIPKAQSRLAKPVQSARSNRAESSLKQSLTYIQRVEVIEWYHANGENQTKTARHFSSLYPGMGVSQSNISRWLKNETRIQDIASTVSGKTKRKMNVKFPKVEELLVTWVRACENSGQFVTGDQIKEKWNEFARLEKIKSKDWLTLTNGWLDGFKARHNLRQIKRHGEAASASPELVKAERERVCKITAMYEPGDVYNMDETGLFYAMPPDRGLATHASAGVKGAKARLTIVCVANADGSDKCHLTIIGQWKSPRCFNKKSPSDLGIDYYHNKTSWMTSVIFETWITKWDRDLRAKGRTILLLLDNFSGHTVPANLLTNIRLEFFTPNLTAHVQPLDAGIIHAFKCHYRKRFLNRAFRRLNDDTTSKKVYDIDILTAARIAKLAWHSVSRETIKNCWAHSGIIDFKDNVVLPVNDRDNLSIPDGINLEEDLQRLQDAGLLSTRNRMSISELLNPEDETPDFSTALTAEDVFALVNPSEDKNDGDNDDSEPEPVPTTADALAAVHILLSHLEGTGTAVGLKLDYPLQKYAEMLESELFFGNKKQVAITDFFKRIPISNP